MNTNPDPDSAGPKKNFEKAKSGRVRGICHACGKKSVWVAPEEDGQPDIFDMASGWSQAPYSADFIHADGSVGSNFWCPACNRRRCK